MGDRRAAIAHLAPDGRTHDLAEHLRETGRRAASHASAWGAGEHAELAGVWHDLGKYAADFQRYIGGAVQGADAGGAHLDDTEVTGAPGKRVDHSSAGAVLASRLGPAGNALAFVIAGHHAGLADATQLKDRLARTAARLDQARAGEPPADILSRSVPEMAERFAPRRDRDPAAMRRFELWTRMLFSALCDADFLDTEAFFDPSRAALRDPTHDLRALASRLGAHLDSLARDAPATEVNAVRREVRAACLEAARGPRGVLTLTVPTGGGKTLASMELALHHALHHDLRRVIVAIPFTSILEQSAAAYRQAFGATLGADDDPVLEHHSAFDPRHESPRSRLSAERWDAPVVVTTTVQLFESLLARRTSRCRKLHNVARSVIVLDEAQTMPRHLLQTTLEVLEQLTLDYGCTVVVCTATQPALSRVSLGDFGFEAPREVVPASLRAFDRLRRVRVRWPATSEATTWEALAGELAIEPDVLAITHRRKDARALCEALDARLGGASTVHLSALMCPEHRSERIAAIKARKGRAEPVRVVSTQLVEAGVDLDFPVVYRAMGGLDALAQAAGRCNREGRLHGLGELRVYRAPTPAPPGILAHALDVAEAMRASDAALDLLAPEVYRRFFERLYRAGSTDRKDIQELRAKLCFEQVAQEYRLIEDEEGTLVVRFGRAGELLDQLDRFGPSRRLLRSLARFGVGVRRKKLAALIAGGVAVEAGEGTVVALAPHFAGAYDARFGLDEDALGVADAGALIVDG